MKNPLASLYYQLYKLSKNSTAIFIAVLVAIFITIAVLYYIYKLKPKLDNTYISNKEFRKTDSDLNQGSNNATLYFFYTTWCPHCKVAKPEMEKLKEAIKGGVNDINVTIVHVDCDKEADLADQYNVVGYPTIKLVFDNKVYDYDAKPNKDTLMMFLNESLQ